MLALAATLTTDGFTFSASMAKLGAPFCQELLMDSGSVEVAVALGIFTTAPPTRATVTALISAFCFQLFISFDFICITSWADRKKSASNKTRARNIFANE
jgi:hypothetical protein